MTVHTPHLRALLLASVLALAAVGCGVETSSDGASNTAPGAPSPSSGNDDSTTEPAPATTAPEDTTDEPATTEPADDVTIPDLPDGIDEDTFRDSLATGFESAGLTPEQATCVADGYLEEFGTDTGSASDYTAMLDLFTACDVDLMDLGG